jgi:hypothetical protein
MRGSEHLLFCFFEYFLDFGTSLSRERSSVLALRGTSFKSR